MLTKDAISPNLTTGTVLISLIGFVVVYAVLMGVDIFLLLKFAKAGLPAGDSDSVLIPGETETKKKGGK
jgi:cytochrome d ubiquinol oxidase subunit I